MTVLTYMQIEGEKQGLITRGASTQESIGNLWQEGMEDWTQVLSGEHRMTALFDDWKGNFIKPKKKGHQPFQIVKRIDKSSPLLDNALVRGETLKKCCLKFYRYTENGAIENYYTITLYDARVVDIQTELGIDEYNYGGMETERVAFAYNRIAHEHNAAGTSGSCAWNDKAYLLHHTPWTEPERTPEPTVVSKPEPSEPEVQNTSYGMSHESFMKFSTPAKETSMLDNAKQSLHDIEIKMAPQQDIAFLSLPEAKEFLDNLWAKTHAKDIIGKGKEVKEALEKVSEAKEIAEGLGGLGVIAYTKTYKGDTYIILKNFKKDMKTLLAGTRYKANNPKVIELGLGMKGAINELKIGFRGTVFFAAALDFVDYAMSDKQTWIDLVGHIGSDVVKGILASTLAVGTVAIAVVLAPIELTVFATSAITAGLAFGYGVGIDYEDDDVYKVTDKLIDKLKEAYSRL